jgi:hypothetical protein
MQLDGREEQRRRYDVLARLIQIMWPPNRWRYV